MLGEPDDSVSVPVTTSVTPPAPLERIRPGCSCTLMRPGADALQALPFVVENTTVRRAYARLFVKSYTPAATTSRPSGSDVMLVGEEETFELSVVACHTPELRSTRWPRTTVNPSASRVPMNTNDPSLATAAPYRSNVSPISPSRFVSSVSDERTPAHV